ncbi:MAG: VOC family protein [Microcoleus sp. SIO2G3]|nr:VOC family protein [Microcoleus sp. SIO2G3]
MQVAIQGLFETHLTVRKLATSIAFYQDVVGLELACLLPDRTAAFFWIGGRGQAMLGLWEVGDAPNGMRLHLAFTSTVEQILTAPSVLRSIVAAYDRFWLPCFYGTPNVKAILCRESCIY